MTVDDGLYPDIEPHHTGFLERDGHALYYELSEILISLRHSSYMVALEGAHPLGSVASLIRRDTTSCS